MKKVVRLVLSLALGLVIAATLGWLWGASGRAATESLLQTRDVQVGLYRARSHVLEARVELYNLNFGAASKQLELGKESLRGAQSRLHPSERDDRSVQYDEAIRRIEEAQGLANKLDQAANSKADEALKSIDAIIEGK